MTEGIRCSNIWIEGKTFGGAGSGVMLQDIWHGFSFTGWRGSLMGIAVGSRDMGGATMVVIDTIGRRGGGGVYQRRLLWIRRKLQRRGALGC